jgi:hypothetical protein
MILFSWELIRRRKIYGSKTFFCFCFSCVLIFLLTACANTSPSEDISNEPVSSSDTTTNDTPSPYSKEQLQPDLKAPSTNPADYNSNGEYVPATGHPVIQKIITLKVNTNLFRV